MKPIIKSIKITKLFGYRTVLLNFEEPYKILVGENGMGKTTIINCLFYTLKQKFDKLEQYVFESIEITFEKSVMFFTHTDVMAYNESKFINNNTSIIRSIEILLKPRDYTTLKGIVFSNVNFTIKAAKVKKLLYDRGFRAKASDLFIYNQVRSIIISYVAMLFSRSLEKLDFLSEYEILYLPTYRRVETPITGLLNGLLANIKDNPLIDENEILDSVKNDFVHFGMDDVDQLIESVTQDLSNRTRKGFGNILNSTLSFLSDDLGLPEGYNRPSNSTIEILLDRQGNELSAEVKEKIKKYITKGKNDKPALDYLIYSLYKLYQENSALDDSIRLFSNTCNEYLFEKKFIYDEANMKLSLFSTNNNQQELKLDVLSSGEKQIISIFANLFLKINKKFIILFDEPELSLSVLWQKRLLPDIVNSRKSHFLLCVTHSPFIFDNNMEAYTSSLTDQIE